MYRDRKQYVMLQDSTFLGNFPTYNLVTFNNN